MAARLSLNAFVRERGRSKSGHPWPHGFLLMRSSVNAEDQKAAIHGRTLKIKE
jgi:hypothetical protein